MNAGRFGRTFLLPLVVVFLAGTAQAAWNDAIVNSADYNTQGITESFTWSDAAQWVGGNVPTNAAGQTVSVEPKLNGTATYVITLDQDVTVGTLYSRVTQGANYYFMGPGKLTFDNGVNEAVWYLHRRDVRVNPLRTGFTIDVEMVSDLHLITGGARMGDPATTNKLGGTISGDGHLTLSLATQDPTTTRFFQFGADGANTYTGGTTIQLVDQVAGSYGVSAVKILQFDARSTGAFGTGDVTLDATGCNGTYTGQFVSGRGMWIRFHADEAIADIAKLNIISASRLAFDLNGFNQTVSGLKVDGTDIEEGIYSGGDFTWLYGSGSLIVIPEPATAGVLLFGLGGLVLRRRALRT